MGGREVSRPYRVWFFTEGELFFMFLFQSPCIFPLHRYYHTAQKKGGCLGGILPDFY